MKHKLLILSLLLTFAANIFAASPQKKKVYPFGQKSGIEFVCENGYWNVYKNGEMLYDKLTWDYVKFENGYEDTYLKRIQIRHPYPTTETYNFMNRYGEMISPYNFTKAENARIGQAIVKGKPGPYADCDGIIDRYGQWIIEPSDKTYEIENFKDIAAFVSGKDGKTRILNIDSNIYEIEGNENGEFTHIEDSYKKSQFINGRAWVYNKSLKKFAIIDDKGKIIVPPIAEKNKDHNVDLWGHPKGGLIKIYIKDWEKTKKEFAGKIGKIYKNELNIPAKGGWAILDYDGNFIIEPSLQFYDVYFSAYEDNYPIIKNASQELKNYKKEKRIAYILADGTIIPFTTWDTLTRYEYSLPISEYLSLHMMPYVNPTIPQIPSSDKIKKIIESRVNEWQKKGEYESSSEWSARVNEKTRNQLIQSIKTEIENRYNDEINLYNERAAKNIEQYNNKVTECLNHYFKYHTENFAKQKMELMPYDADNETFLIRTEKNGDILLPVPRSEARSFADNWELNKSGVKPEFVVNGDQLALKQVRFGNYVYDGKTEANYASTSAVATEFAPLDLSSITAADMNFEAAAAMPANVASVSTPKAKKQVVSDVDVNIPKAKKAMGENTFALVIGNENYRSAVAVEGALNDSKIFAKYLTETYGIPERQIFLHTDATLGDITSAVGRMKNVAKAVAGKDFDVIVYYAGHGVPDDANRSAYLLPVDVDPVSVNVCPTLEGLYADLGNLGARQVTVFLDACFSGAVRGDGMLSHARGIAIKANPGAPKGNTIVLSAASGQETAFPHPQQGHGLFTYFLLKKLQETGGNVTIGELADYVTEKVSRESVLLNNKPQTPTVIRSTDLGDAWRSLPLIH